MVTASVPAMVVRLERTSGSGSITAAELEAALPAAVRAASSATSRPSCSGSSAAPASPQALVINALGGRRFDEVAHRSVYLSAEACRWIIGLGVRLLISDVYESDGSPQGVFPSLFGAGLSCVCNAVNLAVLPASATSTSRVELSCVPLATPGAVQCPVRVLAEVTEPPAARL